MRTLLHYLCRFCPWCANFGGFLGLFLAVAVCRMGSLHQESSLGLLGLSKSSSPSLLGPTWLRQCKETSFLAVAVCRMGSLHQGSSLGLLGLSKSSSPSQRPKKAVFALRVPTLGVLWAYSLLLQCAEWDPSTKRPSIDTQRSKKPLRLQRTDQSSQLHERLSSKSQHCVKHFNTLEYR